MDYICIISIASTTCYSFHAFLEGRYHTNLISITLYLPTFRESEIKFHFLLNLERTLIFTYTTTPNVFKDQLQSKTSLRLSV